MAKSPDLFDEIVSKTACVSGQKVTKTAPVKKRGRGRPKSATTTKKEQEKKAAEFISDFESVMPYRPEPKKLIVALSLPEEEQQEALEAALLPRQISFCRE